MIRSALTANSFMRFSVSRGTAGDESPDLEAATAEHGSWGLNVEDWLMGLPAGTPRFSGRLREWADSIG